MNPNPSQLGALVAVRARFELDPEDYRSAAPPTPPQADAFGPVPETVFHRIAWGLMHPSCTPERRAAVNALGRHRRTIVAEETAAAEALILDPADQGLDW